MKNFEAENYLLQLGCKLVEKDFATECEAEWEDNLFKLSDNLQFEDGTTVGKMFAYANVGLMITGSPLVCIHLNADLVKQMDLKTNIVVLHKTTSTDEIVTTVEEMIENLKLKKFLTSDK